MAELLALISVAELQSMIVTQTLIIPYILISYLEVTGIEKVLPLGNDQLRKIRESYWINQYDSISYGANTRE